ncbi:tubulin delta chain-like [Octopus sinensis]|uniref:Tubulin delta chain n=1 Tax=Octopus sinensis TaxID=2607531 RepID=A0A7E6FNP6_9MOLL|nr:tubulin delta chain-like [Octopus sinensis]
MSVVTLQLGQCGNQIGGEFYNTLLQDLHIRNPHVSPRANENYIQEAIDRFFVECKTKSGLAGLLEARAVMVDMEPKVIVQTCQLARRSGLWRYPVNQQLCHQRGSGNNWANGFLSCGPKAKETVMNMIRKEAEKCDCLGGFLCLMSVAGGTGSGVGAYLTRCLRDVYPNAFILNQVIWPYHTGEVIVQNYNALLTLSNLYQTSDGILLINNDQLQDICTRRLHIKQVTFENMNCVVADQLTSLLQPVYKANTGKTVHNCLGDMLQTLTPHPEYKLLMVKKTPQVSEKVAAYNSDTWTGLLKHLRQMQLADSATDEGINWSLSVNDDVPRGAAVKYNRSLSSLLMLRGEQLATADTALFQDQRLYTPWTLPELSFTKWYQPRSFQHYDKSATLVSNSQMTAKPLNHVVSRAWDMFSAKAFFHQYCDYGLTASDFLDSFACLEQIIANYASL